MRTYYRKRDVIHTQEKKQEKKILYLPYVRGVADKIEHLCHTIDPSIQPVFKSSSTLCQSLVHVKTPVTTERNTVVVY